MLTLIGQRQVLFVLQISRVSEIFLVDDSIDPRAQNHLICANVEGHAILDGFLQINPNGNLTVIAHARDYSFIAVEGGEMHMVAVALALAATSRPFLLMLSRCFRYVPCTQQSGKFFKSTVWRSWLSSTTFIE